MRLRLTFVEPFEWTKEADVPKDVVMRFRSLDELAEYIVDTYFYSDWVRAFERIAEAERISRRKRWEAKHRYRDKMTEYVKKWIIEAVMTRLREGERERGW